MSDPGTALLQPDQVALRDLARSFAAEHIVPHTAEWDRTATFPHAAVKGLGRLGFFGLTVPSAYGGTSGTWGGDAVAVALAVEELSFADATCGLMVSMANSLTASILMDYANEAQKQAYLVPAARGEVIASFVITEAHAGSDAGAIRMAARPTDRGYVLSGSKHFITAGSSSDFLFVFAVTDPDRGSRGLSCFLVPANAKGLSVARREDKMGLRASDTAELRFDDVEVPADALLGERGQGYRIALSSLGRSRIGIAAQATGIARAALTHALAYARERTAFGKPIVDHQGIGFMLADMKVDVAAAWEMTLSAARYKDSGGSDASPSAMAKLFAAQAAERVCSRAIQVFGGYGYLKDYPVERLYRDARVCQIYEGTNEMLRIVIARELAK